MQEKHYMADAPSKSVRQDEKKVFFPNMDALRFFAFFIVYLQHGFGEAIPSGDSQGIIKAFRDSVFYSGWAGVSFFFVLSGFLITYLILTEIEIKGKVDVLAFYVRRILRIWPLYYLVLFFGFAIYPYIKTLIGLPSYAETGKAIYYLFFLGNFDVINTGSAHTAMSVNITWSVAIEEQFYLMWPLLFYFIPKKFYKLIFPAIIIISFVFRLRYAYNDTIIYFHTLSVISDMAVGGLCAYLMIKSEKFKERISNIPHALIVLIYIAGITLFVFRSYVFNSPLLESQHRLVFSLFFVFIVLEQNFCLNSIFKVGRLKTISKLGIYTYGLYLIHPIALTLLIGAGKALKIEDTFARKMSIGVIGFFLSIAMSIFSYHFFEEKFLKLKKRFTYIPSAQTNG